MNREMALGRMRRAALVEIERASNKVSVWIITKDGEIRGRITLRWKRKRGEYVAHIAFFMYSITGYLIPIGATTNMYGFGYDKFNFGMAEIIDKLKPELCKYFGIRFSKPDWNIINTWESAFKEAGYEVFRAL